MDKSRRGLLSTALPIGAAAAIAVGAARPARGANTVQSLSTAINTLVPGVGGFIGALTINPANAFQTVNGVLTVSGTIVGTLLNSTGGTLQTISQSFSAPVGVAASCQILSLTLGPLDLNLLGLMVHLNQVVLTITAVPGAGNLLGNLLCDVANLLNSGGGTGGISALLSNLATLLNQILGAL